MKRKPDENLMQLPDRSYELKHTSYGKMINVRASEIQPNISLPNTVDSAATIGETKRVTADQKDLANRDRVSYITLLGHRIQDRSSKGEPKLLICD
ncbi:MAG: hypothetical protein JSW12_11525, partial [Deltaproteobacteria bacterium]